MKNEHQGTMVRVTECVSAHFGYDVALLRSRGKTWKWSYARHVAMYLIREQNQKISDERIAWFFGRSRVAISLGRRRIQDLLDGGDAKASLDIKSVKKLIDTRYS